MLIISALLGPLHDNQDDKSQQSHYAQPHYHLYLAVSPVEQSLQGLGILLKLACVILIKIELLFIFYAFSLMAFSDS